MSQRDLVAELRGARLATPDHVREQVRLIAASAKPPARRITWRRVLVVAVPAAAAIAAVVVVTRPAGRQAAQPSPTVLRAQAQTATVEHGQASKRVAGTNDSLAPLQSPNRAQRYEAYLALRVRGADGVSNGVKRAQRIAVSLGGYSLSVRASSESEGASADLTLKVPRAHVQEAITRLSALGTITGEEVDVQDVQAGLNATDRLIARLQRQLQDLRAQEQTDTVKQRIDSITARVVRLQRQEATTLRETHYSTVQLHLATKSVAPPAKHHHGPLHGLGVAFRWIGIGAVYALALGTPLVVALALVWLAARTVRRRREDALLSRP